MSRSRKASNETKKAVALQYGAGNAAPVVVASGMGYMAERIVEAAADCGVPIYEDNSLATILTQLKLGQEIPEELYKAIVEIYVYFLHFDPTKREQEERRRKEEAQRLAEAEAENSEEESEEDAAQNSVEEN